MSTRLLIGLGIGSGFEAADAIAVRADGFGLGMSPRVVGSGRVPFPSDLQESGRAIARHAELWPARFAQEVGETLAAAARYALVKAGGELGSALAAGLLCNLPDGAVGQASPADWLAERTGLTVISGFAGRDLTAGGLGRLITPAADFLLFRDAFEQRILLHLGAVTSVVLLPVSNKVTDVVAFEAGPGNQLLDDITSLGTRGREPFDPGGTKAVQGRCDDALLERWLSLPFLGRDPPRPVPPTAFDDAFLTDAFEVTRQHGGTLLDLLCTATHYIARCICIGCERWLSSATVPRRMFVSGGGARNGFLSKLLAKDFPDGVERFDALDVPAAARRAAAAAVLAGLTLDGVAANLPQVTGASGSRLVGRMIPGDRRNWAACTAWMAERLADSGSLGRAA